MSAPDLIDLVAIHKLWELEDALQARKDRRPANRARSLKSAATKRQQSRAAQKGRVG